MHTEAPAPAGGNACDSLLHDLNRGRVMNQLNESFVELVKDVRRLGKAGTLILSLKIAPADNSNAERVNVSASIATKPPTEVPYSGLYFTTEDGRVQKTDPNQTEMEFKPLPSAIETAPIQVAQTAAQ